MWRLRYVAGNSMLPILRDGQLVVVTPSLKSLQVGDIITVQHNGVEKIKRLAEVDQRRGIFVLGDNPQASTDSRAFGWLNPDQIVGKVIWPKDRS